MVPKLNPDFLFVLERQGGTALEAQETAFPTVSQLCL
jgi:ABC-type enterochelin transport system substrate-binding protein